MENDLAELHSLANTTFQNVQNLTPSIRQMVVHAKVYQKSIQTSCNVSVVFIDSIQNIAKAALISEGATKKIGDVITDIIDAFKEIENTRLELINMFINEVIIPLESKAENEISNAKSSHKNYASENKSQSEAVEKARSGVNKYKKRSLRKKGRSIKLEEKTNEKTDKYQVEEIKLKEVRQLGLRKALVDERRMYCFVADRMCAYGRGLIVYNNRISRFLQEKIPDWQQFISKPTELPPESEDIIANPTQYKIGTVKRKVPKTDHRKDSIKRGKSFSLHYPNKYSTYDGRSSRGNSRPSLAALTIKSSSNLSEGTPRSLRQSPQNLQSHASLLTPPESTVSDFDVQSVTSDSTSTTTNVDGVKMFVAETTTPDSTTKQSEYANLVSLNNSIVVKNNDQEEQQLRSHSFSLPKKQNMSNYNRQDSATTEMVTSQAPSTAAIGGSEFTRKLSVVQNQLKLKLDPTNTSMAGKNRLKAKYDHAAKDASQLDFSKDDVINPLCEPTSGWQYGENIKTKKSGWFPASYTEQVIISMNGESHKKPTRTYSTSTNYRKFAPPVAKKSIHGPARRKITSGSTVIVPTVDSNENGDDSVQQKMTGSSSVPQMIHMLSVSSTGDEETKDENSSPPQRKHSNSMNAIEIEYQQDSFDDCTSDEAQSPPPPPHVTPAIAAITKTHKKKSYDMPPPPPPPELLDDGDETFIVIKSEKSEELITPSKKKLSTFNIK